jgi:hypothetical protein
MLPVDNGHRRSGRSYARAELRLACCADESGIRLKAAALLLTLKEPNISGQRLSSASSTGTGVVASRADEYRRRAQQCLVMARTFGDHDARIILSYMAEAWLRLADLAAPEQQRRPIVQQQQQLQPKDEDK